MVGAWSGGSGVEALVRASYDRLWNAWDDDAVDEVLAEGFTSRGSLGQATVGRGGWRAYRDTVRRGSSDVHDEVVRIVVEGDSAAVRLRWSGTHTGDLLGVPATGRRFSCAGAAFFTSAGGRLVDAWVLGDLAALGTQLSAPTSAP